MKPRQKMNKKKGSTIVIKCTYGGSRNKCLWQTSNKSSGSVYLAPLVLSHSFDLFPFSLLLLKSYNSNYAFQIWWCIMHKCKCIILLHFIIRVKCGKMKREWEQGRDSHLCLQIADSFKWLNAGFVSTLETSIGQLAHNLCREFKMEFSDNF